MVVWGPIFVKGWVLAPGEAGKTGSSLGDEDDESMEIQMFFCHFRSSQKVWLFLAVRFMRVLRGGGLQGEDFCSFFRMFLVCFRYGSLSLL